MAWLQLHFPAADHEIEALYELLERLGAVAVTCTDAADQPLLEPAPGATPLWQQVRVSALFETGIDTSAVAAALAAQLDRDPQLQSEQVQDQAWERAWMADFHPQRFGQRLWIVPSWCEAPDPDAINLHLDPGLAFGSGSHETTALCLEWLGDHDLQGRQVLDVGCGSGVLAIAALLLGAEQACACDIDPQALLATADNATANQVQQRLHCCLADALPAAHYDLLLANILAGPLIDLAAQLANYCRPGADLLLSGILRAQAQAVTEAYQPWFNIHTTVTKGDWVRIHGTRLPASAMPPLP